MANPKEQDITGEEKDVTPAGRQPGSSPVNSWITAFAGMTAILTFALYLHTMGPTLVPYRDAGEMSTSIARLGILHPPGYPLYTLVGHLFMRLPLANPAYRLNLFSALALSLAWAVLFLLGCELWGLTAAVLTVLLGAVSFQFWMHALVSEMYTLNLLVIGGLLWLIYRKQFEAAAFLFGLGLGVRMDLMLCGPAFVFLALAKAPRDGDSWKRQPWIVWARLIAFCLLGLSVFLYLWIRANGHPLLNWGDPATLDRFLASVMRRSYAGTLDLLSQSYHRGENFVPEFRLYVRHLSRDFSLLSWPLAALGLAHLWRTNRAWFGALLLGWVLTGPLFIFLGNLPPNPHAVAILEASYLTPDIFYLLMIGWGLACLQAVIPAKAGIQSRLGPWTPAFAGVTAVYGLVGILIIAQAERFYPVINKRNNWVAADFIRNVYKGIPEPSIVVARSDVPIFALFYGHWVYPRFKWRVPIAQGLASSAWYPVMMEHDTAKLAVGPLQTAADWEAVAKANPGWSLFGTQDTDWTEELHARMVPTGLLLQFLPRGVNSVTAADVLLSDLAVYRGRYRYDAYHEFFTPELIEEYAKAWMEWGKLLEKSGNGSGAAEAFLHALALKPDMPYPPFQLGFYYFQKNDLVRADYYYNWAISNFRHLDAQATAWKSFAALRVSLHQDEAQAMAHWGVIKERLGNIEQAIALYQRALDVDPRSADARYNLAVIYWRQQRWQDVVDQLQALGAAHPEDTRWRVYLPQALKRLKP